jgi:hypothetical protein
LEDGLSVTARPTDLYSALEESARLVNVPCAPDKVWPILNTFRDAYGDALGHAVIAFRVATSARHEGDLDCRFTMLPNDVDPYALALSKGFVNETGHPSDALLSNIRERCPIDCYGIDFGLVAGFTKTWSFFPQGTLQELPALAGIPSMPPSLGENESLLARYGLNDRVHIIGIDYQYRTLNVYFGELRAESLEPDSITSMVREIGLPDPSEEMLKLGRIAFGIYATLSWDSPKIERICFAVATPDLLTLPVRPEPKIERFVKNFPYNTADPKFVYAVTLTPGGEYCKVQAYYQWRPRMLSLLWSD